MTSMLVIILTGLTLFFKLFHWCRPDQWRAIFVWGNGGMLLSVFAMSGIWLTLRKSSIPTRALTLVGLAVPSVAALVISLNWATQDFQYYDRHDANPINFLFAFFSASLLGLTATVIGILVLRISGRMLIHENDVGNSSSFSIAEVLAFVTLVAAGFACLERSGSAIEPDIKWIAVAIAMGAGVVVSFFVVAPQLLLLSSKRFRFGLVANLAISFGVGLLTCVFLEGATSNWTQFFPNSWRSLTVSILCPIVAFTTMLTLFVMALRLLGFRLQNTRLHSNRL